MSHQKQIPVDFIQGKLSNHPKIVKTLSLLWGSKAIDSYYLQLVFYCFAVFLFTLQI